MEFNNLGYAFMIGFFVCSLPSSSLDLIWRRFRRVFRAKRHLRKQVRPLTLSQTGLGLISLTIQRDMTLLYSLESRR